MLRFSSVAFVVLAGCLVASAQVSNVVSAPDHKVRKEGQLVFQYRLTTSDENLDSSYSHDFKATFGLGYGFEIGFQTNFDGKSGLGAKYQFYTSEDGLTAASVGILDITDEKDLFVAVGRQFEGITVTGGFLANDNDQLFVGLKTPWMDKLRFSADHIATKSGKTSLRAQYNLGSGFDLDVRMFIPNSSGKSNTYRFGINYGMQF